MTTRAPTWQTWLGLLAAMLAGCFDSNEPQCQPETRRCSASGKSIEKCNVTGTAWVLLDSCRSDEVCQDEQCQQRAADAGVDTREPDGLPDVAIDGPIDGSVVDIRADVGSPDVSPDGPSPPPTCVPYPSGVALSLAMDRMEGPEQDLRNRIDCAPAGTVSRNTEGRVYKAIHFGADGRLNCGNPSGLNNLTGLTIAAWIRADTSPTSSAINQGNIVAKTAGDANDGGFSLRHAGNVLEFVVDASGGRSVAVSPPIPAATWIHVVAIWDGQTAVIDVDGARGGAFTATGTLAGNAVDLLVGNSKRDTSSYGFIGRIDELRIWPRALTAQEIQRLRTPQQGWIVLPAAQTGAVEIWAIRDDGSGIPVRLTDGLTDGTAGVSGQPRVSKNGTVLALSTRQPAGTFDTSEAHVWLLESDGSNFRHLLQVNRDQSLPDWDADGIHIYYQDNSGCSENVMRIDASAANPTGELVKDAAQVLSRASAHPLVSGMLLVHEFTCAPGNDRLRLLDSTGALSTLFQPWKVASLPRWSADGTKYAVWHNDGAGPAGPTISIRSLGDPNSRSLYTDPAAGSLYQPFFGNDDTRVYVQRLSGSDYVIDVIDVTTGRLVRTLSTLRTDRLATWACLDDIDYDNDGLANGIDPTPGTP